MQNLLKYALFLMLLTSFGYADTSTSCLNMTTQQTVITQTMVVNNNYTNITITENTFCQYNCTNSTGQCSPAKEASGFELPIIIAAVTFFFLAQRVKEQEWYIQVLFTGVGLVCLVIGGQMMVLSAVNTNTINLLTLLEIILTLASVLFLAIIIITRLKWYLEKLKDARLEKEKDRL